MNVHRCPRDHECYHLTDTDTQFLELMARGLGNDQISQRLSYTPQAVKNRVHHLYGTFGVHAGINGRDTLRLQTVLRAARAGLVDLNAAVADSLAAA